MTDEELQKIWEEMVDYFDGNIPNPEQEPRRFAYYVKLFKYYKERKRQNA